MHFEFDEKHYKLEFRRQFKEIEQVRKASSGTESKIKKIKSLHPYTSAILWLIPKTAYAPAVLVEATVGCATMDTFCKATGRLEALRSLSRALRISMRNDKDRQQKLTKLMWEAYNNRAKITSKAKEATESAA